MPVGAGAADAQGVFMYGESTPAGPLFSDFLNLAPASISAAILADRNRLTALERRTIRQRLAAQSVASGASAAVATPVAFDTNVQNLGASFNLTGTTLVCTRAGTYRIDAMASFVANATGARWLFILKAAAASPTSFNPTPLGYGVIAAATSSQPQQIATWDVLTLAAGDVLQIAALQNSGAALNITAAAVDVKAVA